MILVTQYREDITKDHEQECINRRIPEGVEVKYVSIFEEPEKFKDPEKFLENVDKLIIGGSAGFSIAEGHDESETDYDKVDFILNTVEPLIRYIFEHDFPTFGACFGIHLFGHFLGGKVVFDNNLAETGTEKIFLTEEGQKDPLFKGMPSEFIAVEGHQDSLLEVPDGCVHLAYNEKCPVQAIRYKNNLYACQFHVELDKEELVYRVGLFPKYKAAMKDMEFLETPETIRVLRNFFAM